MNALAHQTRIAVNVIVDDDTGSVTGFLTALTALIGLLLLAAADFTIKVLAIGLSALAFLLLIVSLTVAVYWDEITALVLAIAYIAVGLATATAVIIGFIGTWLLIEKVRTLRARRIEAEKQAHVLTNTDNGQTWVRDTNPRAVYRNLTGTPALYVNGKQHQPAEWEMELYRYRLESMARLGSGRPTGPVVPGYATLLPPSLNLLAELDTVQRCLIVGASDSGKTTLLQHIITRRLATSKVVVIDPHAYPGKWGGCIVVGTGRNYTPPTSPLAVFTPGHSMNRDAPVSPKRS